MGNVKNQVEKIALALSEIELSEFTQPGLLSGSSGIACFLFEYAKYAQDELTRQKALDIIDRTIDLVFEGDPYPTHCSGLAGIAHFLSDLEKWEGLGNYITKDIDTYLEHALKSEIAKDHYDFLHGAVGISYYFVNRAGEKKKYQRVVKLIVDYLDSTAVRNTEDGIGLVKWKSYNSTKGRPEYNISMSHGMSGIVVVLSKILKIANATTRNLVIPLLEGAVNYILHQQIDKEGYGSFFPYTSIESSESLTGTRLAWCYGDLGIALALWQAGISLENEHWKNKAIEVLLHAADRRDNAKNIVVDACFCHGTAGIAQIYNRMYRNAGIEKFKETADFWIEETLKMAKFNDGLAGYKTFHGKYGMMNDAGMLEGISGTGLALLTSLSESDSSWDKYFLLS